MQQKVPKSTRNQLQGCRKQESRPKRPKTKTTDGVGTLKRSYLRDRNPEKHPRETLKKIHERQIIYEPTLIPCQNTHKTQKKPRAFWKK